MKQKLHKIISVFLSLTVLFSSFSYTVNKHVCGGEVLDTAWFVQAESCGMEMGFCENDTQFSSDTEVSSVNTTDCCQDVHVLVKGVDTNQQAQEFAFSFSQFSFIVAYTYSFVLRVPSLDKVAAVLNYEPPLLVRNIQSFFQVFRI